MSEWVRATLAALTLDEKLSLLSGKDLWHSRAVDRVGLPTLKVTDGPNGARGADGNHGPTSMSFPVPAAMGATWDPALIGEVGVALAHETISKGAHVLLGPTVNIPRVPNAGRNFECYSEDPLLSGLLGAEWIRGIQSEGVAACLKHFVCNDQEHDRYDVDAVVDERSLREIYLEPFRIAVESAHPWSAMSAYNTVNGVTASEQPLLDDVLRDEFGFDGMVISDWFGTYSDGVMTSGLDLEMPGPGRWLGADRVRAAVDAGEVTEADIDRKVERLLVLLERTDARNRQDLSERAQERPEDRALARRVATESMVLLANDGLLPLDRPTRVAVIGELAETTPNQGGGSSSVNPHRVVSILDGIRAAVGPDVEVTWTPGYSIRKGAAAIDPASLGEDGFLIEYFDNDAPTGTPVRSVSSTRSFLNLFGSEDEWLDFDRCAVRLSGRFTARVAGHHRFWFAAEGRLRVSIDGDRAVDLWDGASEGEAIEMDLQAGESFDLSVEYASVPGLTYRFLSLGCNTPGEELSIHSAVNAAEEADVAIVVAGLTLEWEAEGFDRPNLDLPGTQNELIAAVAAAQPRTAVVMTAGAPVLMPWIDDVGAVLWAWYGGQEVGHAVADVLWGTAEPAGRLPVTFPADSRQHPGLLNYPGEEHTVRYGEGVYVGYRGFDRLGLEPAFPFGHGLSYSTFEAEAQAASTDDDGIRVDVRVTNTGDRSGADVIRVFARDIGGVDRRLVGFAKTRVAAGDSVDVRVTVPLDRLRSWTRDGWRVHEGPLTLSVEGSFAPFSMETDLPSGS